MSSEFRFTLPLHQPWPGYSRISTKKFDVAELCDGNYRCKAYANTPAGFLALYKWLNAEAKQDIHVCLEATGNYGTSLATCLYKRNLTVRVVNPARIKGYGSAELSQTKTDKADSSSLHVSVKQQFLRNENQLYRL
ncbi:transposase [Klebsiella aerogenes]